MFRKHNSIAKAKKEFISGSFPKDKHFVLPLEDLHPFTSYSFNLSPAPFLQMYDSKNRLSEVITEVTRRLDSILSLWVDYRLYPEISTKSQNIHFHGTLFVYEYAELAQFYMRLPLLKEFAAFEIDSISDLDIWETYCKKQKHLIKPLCDHYGIFYGMKNDLAKMVQPRVIIKYNKYKQYKYNKNITRGLAEGKPDQAEPSVAKGSVATLSSELGTSNTK